MNASLLFAALFITPVLSSIPIALAYRRGDIVRKLPPLSVAGIFVSLICSLYILFHPDFMDKSFSYDWLPHLGMNIVIRVDYLSASMGVITALIAFIIAVYGLDYMRDDYRLPWYWFFFNLFTASMLLVVYSDNLFLLFVGWEGLGIASWGLIGHWYRDDDEITFVGVPARRLGPLNLWWPPSIGGWRAISTIRFGDVPMFIAIAAIWMLSEHHLNISEINWESVFSGAGMAGTVIIFTMLLLGLFTKSAQFPFSEWLMTAMTGPTTVSALLHSATMVAAGAFVFIKLSWYIRPWELHHVPGLEFVYAVALFIGLISALYGALVATGMLERKVLLAASTMSSLGMMFGCAAASYWISPDHAAAHGTMNIALLAAFWYMAVHAFAKATLFLVSGHLIHATHSRFSERIDAGEMLSAFIATVLATALLVGFLPPAYFVKSAMDEVMEHLFAHDMISPFLLLVAASVCYAAILSKFLSLNFLKGEKAHQEHFEGAKLMKAGYLMMVSVLFILIFIIMKHEETHEFISAGSKMPSMAVALAVAAAYFIAIFKPSVEALSRIGTFFNDRMLLPALNDFISPAIGFAVARAANLGNRAIDAFCNTKVMPALFEILSRVIRAIQTGNLRDYTQIVLGIVMFFLVIGALWGVMS